MQGATARSAALGGLYPPSSTNHPVERLDDFLRPADTVRGVVKSKQTMVKFAVKVLQKNQKTTERRFEGLTFDPVSLMVRKNSTL